MGTQVTVRDGTRLRYIVEPVKSSPDETKQYIYAHPKEVPGRILNALLEAPLLALDFETRGNDISDPEFTAVGFAVSTDAIALYVDLRSCSLQEKKEFLEIFAKRPLIGHNVFFDGGVFYRELGIHANWQYCTYGLFKQLSSESQALKWGLKNAQTELLGWGSSNETELDQWLVDNDHHGQDCRKTDDEGRRYLKRGTDRYYKPEKGEMWRAPVRILGKYCALDALSTFLLFKKVLEPAMHKVDYAVLKNYHQKDFLIETEILIEQQITGITIDKEQLQAHEELLKKQIQEAKDSFFSHPKIAQAVAEFRESKLSLYRAREPVQFRKPPKLGDEPPQLTKTGRVSQRWISWDERRQKIEDWESDPDNVSKNWEAWRQSLEALEQEEIFNLNSADHLKWLLYDYLGYEVLVTTKSSQPAVNDDALKQMGPEVKGLLAYKLYSKELGYVSKCIEKLRQDSEGYWRIHPQFNNPGTLTGRLAGSGGLNLQQLPKTRGYLSCWKPMEPDKVWIDCDHTALEPTVITELTRDQGMMKVYGPEAKNQDIYLFFGASIPGIGKQIRDAGFDPESPTKEGKANAKKTCKNLRQICKTVVLAKQYNAGARKIHQTLRLNNVDISFEEVQDISSQYNETFKSVKEFGNLLLKEWKENDGWVFNGIGRPMTVAEDYTKDLVNRVVQSTGHDIHMKFLRIFRELMADKGYWYRWIIADFHDQFIIECKEADKDAIYDLISIEVYDRLNKELGGLIPIKGDPQHVNTLADAKLED